MLKVKCNCDSRGDEFDYCEAHSKTLGTFYSNIRKQFRKRKFKCLNGGSTREAWSDKNKRFVYKIPLNSLGIKNNKFEALAYKHRHKVYIGKHCLKDVLAKCKLLKNNILRMEYVAPSDDGLPNRLQHLNDNDGGQHGLNNANKLVMYDYEYGVKIKDRRFTPKAWA